jgi:hypothetical protein
MPFFRNVSEINERQKQQSATVDYRQKKKVSDSKKNDDGDYIEFEETR